MSESHEHYTGLISTVEDYLYELGELEMKLKELEEFLREARDKGAEPVYLEFAERPNFAWFTDEADLMSGWVYSVLYPEP